MPLFTLTRENTFLCAATIFQTAIFNELHAINLEIVQILKLFKFHCVSLTHFSNQCCISYRNQSFDWHCILNDWFLHEMQYWAKMG